MNPISDFKMMMFNYKAWFMLQIGVFYRLIEANLQQAMRWSLN